MLYARVKELVEIVASVGVPVVATGGVHTAGQVVGLQGIAGWYCVPLVVGVATALVQGMFCVPLMNKELARF